MRNESLYAFIFLALCEDKDYIVSEKAKSHKEFVFYLPEDNKVVILKKQSLAYKRLKPLVSHYIELGKL